MGEETSGGKDFKIAKIWINLSRKFAREGKCGSLGSAL